MSGKEQLPQKPSGISAAERIGRFLRNINALGAIAAGAVALIVPPAAAVVFGAWAGINAAQAAGFELFRRHAELARQRRSK